MIVGGSHDTVRLLVDGLSLPGSFEVAPTCSDLIIDILCDDPLCKALKESYHQHYLSANGNSLKEKNRIEGIMEDVPLWVMIALRPTVLLQEAFCQVRDFRFDAFQRQTTVMMWRAIHHTNRAAGFNYATATVSMRAIETFMIIFVYCLGYSLIGIDDGFGTALTFTIIIHVVILFMWFWFSDMQTLLGLFFLENKKHECNSLPLIVTMIVHSAIFTLLPLSVGVFWTPFFFTEEALPKSEFWVSALPLFLLHTFNFILISWMTCCYLRSSPDMVKESTKLISVFYLLTNFFGGLLIPHSRVWMPFMIMNFASPFFWAYSGMASAVLSSSLFQCADSNKYYCAEKFGESYLVALGMGYDVVNTAYIMIGMAVLFFLATVYGTLSPYDSPIRNRSPSLSKGYSNAKLVTKMSMVEMIIQPIEDGNTAQVSNAVKLRGLLLAQQGLKRWAAVRERIPQKAHIHPRVLINSGP
ncbi:hypothetical protein CYMTET_30337 [Cymbomonas tetramitiformis]|uniref:Uncharacterized protein n=1 Tax=Cymbomonas tetramitiformis TaxID=36881 RepID=A0AAE0FKM1_9CHLO|nr:hypothetical protein CYMTET_30337 [Cymbomonas tetramitiformis]